MESSMVLWCFVIFCSSHPLLSVLSFGLGSSPWQWYFIYWIRKWFVWWEKSVFLLPLNATITTTNMIPCPVTIFSIKWSFMSIATLHFGVIRKRWGIVQIILVSSLFFCSSRHLCNCLSILLGTFQVEARTVAFISR